MKLFLVFCTVISFSTWGQFSFVFQPSIPFVKSGQTLPLAMAGGLNYVQVTDFDYDFDGDLDLFLFDRSGNQIMILLNNGTSYEYLYNGASAFPNGIRHRATLVDYNGDGKKDLFTYNLSGLKVFKNTGNATVGLQWELVSNLLMTEANGQTTLFVSSTDIPALVDVEGDGDIDVLTFAQGGMHLEYHQNQSMELYGTADSLIFELKNECWGKFSEDATTSAITLNDPNAPCVGGTIANPLKPKGAAHAGSTVLAYDFDNSGVLDLLLGDISYDNLTYLVNGGTAPNTNSAMVSADPSFPQNSTPVNMHKFPAPFMVDVDFDGKLDLVIGANAKNVSENEKSVLFYKNNGTNSVPIFQYQQDNLFQDKMIDIGTGSAPNLTDINQDGKLDLIVSNFFRLNNADEKISSLHYYLNTGTNENPQFTFIDNDYLNLASLNLGLKLMTTFGDIDNDGDDDLFLGKMDGTLLFFENNATGSGANYTINTTAVLDNTSNTIDVGGMSAPQLFDLNKDGKLDLLIGNEDGLITYYRNTGTLANPIFTLENSNLGGVDVSTLNYPNGVAVPNFVRKNDTTYLLVGNSEGFLVAYDSIDNHLTDSFHLVSQNVAGINVGKYAAPCVSDFDADGNFNLILGQDLGGISHFENDPNSSVNIESISLKDELIIFPNPSDGLFYVKTEHSIKKIQVFDSFGRTILSSLFSNSFDLSTQKKGVYFIEIELNSGKNAQKRVVLMK